MARRELLGLLEACKREPRDDAARLVLADWLEEHGDESDRERADYLRLCVSSGIERGLPALEGVKAHVWQANAARWGVDEEGVRTARSRNGMTEASITSASAAPAARENWAWVGRATVPPEPERLASLLASPLLAAVPDLWLGSLTLGPSAVASLATWQGLPRLRELAITGSSLGDGNLAALLRVPGLQGLRSLVLTGAALSAADYAALRDPGVLPRLDELDLSTADDDRGRDAVLVQGRRPLRRLAMQGFRDVDEVAALAGCETLEALDLSHSLANALFLAPLPKLRSLRVMNCDLGPQAISRLRPLLGQLTCLNLFGNPLGEAGVRELTALDRCPATLVLWGCGLDDAAAERLARWPGLASCRVLELSDNRFGFRGLNALTASPHAANVRSLRLHRTPIRSAPSLRRLFESPLGASLEELNLYGTGGGNALVEALLATEGLTRLRELSLDPPRDDAQRGALRERFCHLRCELFPGG